MKTDVSNTQMYLMKTDVSNTADVSNIIMYRIK